jgi:hypothetical protein
VTLVALCVPWLTKSEPLPSGSPSEQLSSLNILPSWSPEPSPIQSIQSTTLTASTAPPCLMTTPVQDESMRGLLHTDKFIYIMNQRGVMRRCGPTPSLGDCTLFNKLSSTFPAGGPMAVLNSSHIIATSANEMV